MSEAKSVFFQDIRDKKAISRSAHNKGSHSGKGGSVRFPHDNLTKKELEALNGEVKTYNLNAPMSWSMFQTLPDDIKRQYISGIRDRFSGPPITAFATMFGVDKSTVYRAFCELNIPRGIVGSGYEKHKAEFFSWIDSHRVTALQDEASSACSPVESCTIATAQEIPAEPPQQSQNVLSCPSGTLTFDGAADSVLGLLAGILGRSSVRLSATWAALDDDRGLIRGK